MTTRLSLLSPGDPIEVEVVENREFKWRAATVVFVDESRGQLGVAFSDHHRRILGSHNRWRIPPWSQ